MESPMNLRESTSMVEKSSAMPLEENYLKVSKQAWMDETQTQLKILDPNDPIMNRFQDALRAHLTRIDNKLSGEIHELEAGIKTTKKECEIEDEKLYNAQLEIARQQKALEKYQSMLDKIKSLYGTNDQQIKDLKELQKTILGELQAEKSKEKELIRKLENLSNLEASFIEWEKEINKELTISQRVSEKDAVMRRELIQQKQRNDYILFKIMNEVHKIEDEIRYLDDQLQLKDKEKIVAAQMLADASTDLEVAQKDQKILLSTWNSVLVCISQRDNINDQLGAEKKKIRDSFQNLQIQTEKIKKDSNKEMENNEQLTAIHMRLEDELKTTTKAISLGRDKVENLESQFAKTTRLLEQSQKEYHNLSSEYQQYENEEKIIDKDMSKTLSQKLKLEEEIVSNLDDKITHNKVIRHLNKLLSDIKNVNQEQELSMIQTENTYGKNILEIEKLNSQLDNEKTDLQEIENENKKRDKEIEQMRAEIEKCDILLEQKQKKIITLNKKIEEILSTVGEDTNPLDLKIGALERNIDDVELKTKKLKQFWLRQEGNIVTVSQQRNNQIQEINLTSKQITVMEQKNLKLELEIDKQNKEKANIEKTINLSQQRLVQINSRLATQRDLKDELESKNYTMKNEYIKSLQDAETELIKLQNEIICLINEKAVLKDQLLALQRESLSWEKKVQLAIETSKSFKEERNAGGDVALMKSEIHKMEMRLSHLRKIQEKLIMDMEFCITRRDIIMNGAEAKEKRNPRGVHNQRFILRKRLDDQKTKIKQIIKETKQIESNIISLEMEQRKMLEKLDNGQRTLRENEDAIPDIEKQIMEAELIKYHNLEKLVRKQRKCSMLQDVKNGKYKMVFKSEIAICEEIKNQQILNVKLKDIMIQTNHDFPLLKQSIRKILLTLESNQ